MKKGRFTFDDYVCLKKRINEIEKKLSDFSEMLRRESKKETSTNAESITNTEVALTEIFEMIAGGE